MCAWFGGGKRGISHSLSHEKEHLEWEILFDYCKYSGGNESQCIKTCKRLTSYVLNEMIDRHPNPTGGRQSHMAAEGTMTNPMFVIVVFRRRITAELRTENRTCENGRDTFRSATTCGRN